MGLKIKYDTTDVDRSKKAVEAPEPGVYSMKITEVQHLAATEDKNELITFTLRMNTDDKKGKGKGYGVWDRVYLTKLAMWRFDQYLVAAGIDTTKKAKGTIDLDKFLNMDVRVRLRSGEYQGEYRPEVGAVFPAIAEVDDDDEDEDEDGEDVTADEVDEDDEDGEEVDSDDDDDEADEDDEEDEEVADEEDEDDSDGLDDLDRAGLKAVNTERSLGIKVLKSMSDDDLRAAIRAAQAAEGLTDDEEDDEEEEAPAPPQAKKGKAKAAPAKAKYEDLDDVALKKELKDRGLPVKGVRSAWIARLRTNDDDPFAE